MATQNPIEQEGTYPLPEAQLDRFLLHLEVNYPNAEDELAILRLNRGEAKGQQAINKPLLTQQQVFSARQEVLNVHMAEAIENYLVRLVMATRHPANYDAKLAQWLTMGVSHARRLRWIAAPVLTLGYKDAILSRRMMYK